MRMKTTYRKPTTKIVTLDVSSSIAQTTLNISSSARQDNGDALAKPFQMEIEGESLIEGEGFSLEAGDEWKDFMWE